MRTTIQVPYRLVAVDGAYRAFPHRDPNSMDGSREIMAGAADVFIPPPHRQPWPDEVTKRNSYLIGGTGDCYLVADADEIIEGTLDFLPPSDLDVELVRVDGVPSYPIFRFFWHRRGLSYNGAHNWLWHMGKILNLEKHDKLASIRLKHLTTEREQARVEDKGEYYKAMSEQERDTRKAFGI